MSQLTGVVAFLVIFNAFIPYVNSLNVGTSQISPAANLNSTALGNAAHCTPVSLNTSSFTCTKDYGSAGGILGSIVTFGNFIWSIVNLIAILPLAIAFPGWFLYNDMGAPITLAATYNVGFLVLLVFWVNGFVANREYATSIP